MDSGVLDYFSQSLSKYLLNKLYDEIIVRLIFQRFGLFVFPSLVSWQIATSASLHGSLHGGESRLGIALRNHGGEVEVDVR